MDLFDQSRTDYRAGLPHPPTPNDDECASLGIGRQSRRTTRHRACAVKKRFSPMRCIACCISVAATEMLNSSPRYELHHASWSSNALASFGRARAGLGWWRHGVPTAWRFGGELPQARRKNSLPLRPNRLSPAAALMLALVRPNAPGPHAIESVSGVPTTAAATASRSPRAATGASENTCATPRSRRRMISAWTSA